MADVRVWQIGAFLDQAREACGGDRDWLESVRQLGVKAHQRGDGLAVYINQDLGHPELGEWRVVSYGGPESLLETRTGTYDVSNGAQGHREPFAHGEDQLPLTLPDTPTLINWRYQLYAIVPSYQQKEAVGD